MAAGLPEDLLPPLHKRLQQQRTTVEALRRDGHEYRDAERQLRQMEIQFRAEQDKQPRSTKPNIDSSKQRA